MIFLFWGTTPAQAQTATPFITTVTVTVLDENGDPVAFLPIELHIFEYTESIEAIAVGGCGTDESGSCSIEVVDPPNLGGWMEGMINIPGLGMEYIGWSENIKMVVIQLLPGNVMATPETFLHFPIEGQDEIGTDVPLEPPDKRGALLAASLTLMPTATATATSTPLPLATETVTPTVEETALATATPTATPTPATIWGSGADGTNYLLWVALGAAVVAAGAYGFISRRNRPKPKESNPKPDGDA